MNVTFSRTSPDSAVAASLCGSLVSTTLFMSARRLGAFEDLPARAVLELVIASAAFVWMLWLTLRITPRLVNAFISILSVAVVALSIAQQDPHPLYGDLWRGWGWPIAAIASGVVLAAHLFSRRLGVLEIREALWQRALARCIAISLAAWLALASLQPMTGYINIGDTTYRVLEEVAGPLAGNFPGFNYSWYGTSLLGLPLAPIRALPLSGQSTFIAVNLWVNLLVLLVPVAAVAFLRLVNRKIDPSYWVILVASAALISGPVRNTTVAAELGFYLGRLLAPVLLGVLVLWIVSRAGIGLREHFIVALAAMGVLLNNWEWGAPAAVAAITALYVCEPSGVGRRQLLVTTLATWTGVLGAILAIGWRLNPSFFLINRLGVLGEFVRGTASLHSWNNSDRNTVFGLYQVSLAFALSATTLILIALRSEASAWCAEVMRAAKPAIAAAVYLGLWVIGGSVYTLNKLGSGGIPFYSVPLALLSGTLWTVHSRVRIASPGSHRIDFRFAVASKLSIGIALVSLSVSAVYAPSITNEYLRISGMTAKNSMVLRELRGLREVSSTSDEWSPIRLDYVRVLDVAAAISTLDSPDRVGWFGDFGNAIEILLGIENLTGISGLENMVSDPLKRSGCRHLLEQDQVMVVSYFSEESIRGLCSSARIKQFSFDEATGIYVHRLMNS